MWCCTWHTIQCVWSLKQVNYWISSFGLGSPFKVLYFSVGIWWDPCVQKKMCAEVVKPCPCGFEVSAWLLKLVVCTWKMMGYDEHVQSDVYDLWSRFYNWRSFALGSLCNVNYSSVGHLMRSIFWENLCAEGVNPCPYGWELGWELRLVLCT